MTEDGLRPASGTLFVFATKHEAVVVPRKLGFILLCQVFQRMTDIVVRHILSNPTTALDARPDLLIFSIHFPSTYTSIFDLPDQRPTIPAVPAEGDILAENRDK